MDLSFIAPKHTKIRFALEPAYNAVCSLTCLTRMWRGAAVGSMKRSRDCTPEEAKTTGRH